MRLAARSLLAVLGGYMVAIAVVAAASALFRVALGTFYSTGVYSAGVEHAGLYLPASLVWTFTGAAAGGFATAWFALRAPLKHALALAGLVLALKLGQFATGDPRPRWFQAAILLCMPAGATLGGSLSARLRIASAARASSR